MSTQTIYVVFGTSGEYSDRTIWPVIAYKTKEAATKHQAKAEDEATACVEELRKCGIYGDYDERWSPVVKKHMKHDPGFRFASSHTTYYLEEVELSQ